MAVPIALISFAVATRMSAGNGRRLKALMHLDAIGLALFTLTGVQVALDAGISPILAVVLGCITGTAGGMIRDLLCNMTPSLLKEGLYATLSLIGGALYVILLGYVDGTLAAGISFAAILLARIVVLTRQLRAIRRKPSDHTAVGTFWGARAQRVPPQPILP